VSLTVYDSSGLLLRSTPAGTAAALVTAVSFSQSPYDPGLGPLGLSQGPWAFYYDGLDASGSVLRNGMYLFVIHSQMGSQSKDLSVQVRVLGRGAAGVTLVAAPAPVPVGGGPLRVQWLPAVAVQLSLHGLDGGLVRDFGLVAPPLNWDLRASGGAAVAPGVYLLSARVPGQRDGRLLKVAVTR